MLHLLLRSPNDRTNICVMKLILELRMVLCQHTKWFIKCEREPCSSQDLRIKRGAKLIWKARMPSSKSNPIPMPASDFDDAHDSTCNAEYSCISSNQHACRQDWKLRSAGNLKCYLLASARIEWWLSSWKFSLSKTSHVSWNGFLYSCPCRSQNTKPSHCQFVKFWSWNGSIDRPSSIRSASTKM